MSSTSSDEDTGVGDSSFDKSSSNAIEVDTEHRNGDDEIDRDQREGSISTGGGGTGGGDSTTVNVTEETNTTVMAGGAGVTSSSPNNNGETTIRLIL